MQKSLFRWLTCLAGWLLFCISSLTAQDKTQTITGKVVDKDTKMPLAGVNIILLHSEPLQGSTSDEYGAFTLTNIAIGRQVLQAQYIGYESFITADIIVTTGKEIFVEIELVESGATTDEVIVTAHESVNQHKPLNDLSVVSARSFSVEETQRYPSSVNDPSRMAMAFPGVQSNQDNENEIVVRGNSAMGVLWRVEGLDVPNPTHFARAASSGGGVSVFSASLLSNSDFSTGAFAAEYGNAFSGVFDMRFRKGNLSKREYTLRANTLGIDFATEGYFKKGRSSYLVNYRYSTLGILDAVGLYVIRENVRSNYQDLSFNLSFSSKDNRSQFTVFGMGGLSVQYWLTKKDTAQWLSSLDYISEKTGSDVAIGGMTFTRTLNTKSYLKFVLGGTTQHFFDIFDEPLITNPDSKTRIVTRDYVNSTIALTGTYSYKFSEKLRFKAGFIQTSLLYKLNNGYVKSRAEGYVKLLDNVQGATAMTQGYAQLSWAAAPKWTFNAGVHSLYVWLNNTKTIEPRLSAQYKASPNTTLAAAWGLHGRMLPTGTYFLTFQDSTGAAYQPNKNLDIPLAQHAVLSFRQILFKRMALQIELYYQHQQRVPIAVSGDSTYWFFNMRDNYGTIPMQSTGEGRNYGIDFVFEQGFDKGFFFLISGSLFRSEYKALSNEWRRSRMDYQWMASAMAGKEFTFKNGAILQLGLKSFVNGGQLYTPADMALSRAEGVLVLDSRNAYTLNLGRYFRTDTRIAYRRNLEKISYIISLDIQNLTAQVNKKDILYDRRNETTTWRYNPTLLPSIGFQLDF